MTLNSSDSSCSPSAHCKKLDYKMIIVQNLIDEINDLRGGDQVPQLSRASDVEDLIDEVTYVSQFHNSANVFNRPLFVWR
ncbi:hypothetical protein AB6A40_009943 [Gnathostoma spinigerum]|uniref:Uncharacterized protein n=1 Tax=Gnathostoma spinigerum TaxID=75299 RepID=A0ABD6ETD0_9BILA